jgi:hypothetical protein
MEQEQKVERVRIQRMMRPLPADPINQMRPLSFYTDRNSDIDLDVCAVHVFPDDRGFVAISLVTVSGTMSITLPPRAGELADGLKWLGSVVGYFDCGSQDFGFAGNGPSGLPNSFHLFSYFPFPPLSLYHEDHVPPA